MKILEVRDGIVKFEDDGNTKLASFVKIDGENCYVAQVLQIKPAEKTAFAKILFCYDGTLKEYDKTQPQTDDIISDFSSDMAELILDSENSIIIGKTLNGENIKINSDIANSKLLICTDNITSEITFVRNLSKQFNALNKNVIILDTTGRMQANKYTVGKDFKLPLDKSSLKFIYEECLQDATSDSKSVVIDIFKDLIEYSETVDFLPFDTLKSIVDEMVDRQHVFKLLVLKNKLAKFERSGYFAKNKNEVEKINRILNSKCSIIDISKLEPSFLNRYIEYIYETIDKNSVQIIFELSNSVSKKSLKNVYEDEASTIFVSHSSFKYIREIKSLFNNFVIVPSDNFNRIFDIYSTFLRSIKNDSCLIVGEETKYIPFISSIITIDETPQTIKVNKESENEYTITETDPDDKNAVEYIDTSSIVSDNEIIASIDEKSNDTITEIAKNLESDNEIEMFSEDDEPTENIVTDENELAQALELNNEQPEEENENNYTTVTHPSEVVEADAIIDIAEEEPEPQEFVAIEPQEETPENTEISDNEPQDEFISEVSDNINENTEESTDETLDTDEISIELDDDINLDLEDDTDELQEADVTLNEAENVEEIQEETSVTESTEDIQTEVIPLEEDNIPTDEIQEISLDEADENDILVDLADDDTEELEEQVKSEADKIYTTRDEEFSDSDLDLIDSLNNDESGDIETLTDNNDEILDELTDSSEENTDILEEYSSEQEILEENQDSAEILETRSSTTPIVPLYEADIPQEDMVESDPIQQGDSVTHIKYGNGIVEKLVKYGSKTLYMINFDNGGRKLLDPLLTEIKRA